VLPCLAETLEDVPQEWKDGASPARRARKHSLAAYTHSEEPQRSVVAASLEVDAREKELVSHGLVLFRPCVCVCVWM